MEDDTTHDGFHVESPVRPDDGSLLQQPQHKRGCCEERAEEEVPLRHKRSAYRRTRTEFSTPAFEQFQANLFTGHYRCLLKTIRENLTMPDYYIPAEFLAEDAQARNSYEEEHASERWFQQLQAEDFGTQDDLPIVSEERAKELERSHECG
ncbi:hypothetical protein Tco_1428361 [Tanacetum coccineum]